MIAVGIVLGGIGAFVIGGVYYGVVSSETTPSPAAPQRSMRALVVVELARSLAVAAVVGWLLAGASRSGVFDGLVLGLSLSVLPVVLLAGSVFHEGVPVRRAALHAGDWVLKLAAIGVIVGMFC